MKIIALLIALAVSAQAQTLKWTTPVPAFPEGTTSAYLAQIRSDGVGNVVITNYYILNGTNRCQVVWLSSGGKILHTDLIDSVDTTRILRVAGTYLLIHVEGGGSSFLRKYTRKGATVAFVDTPLPNGVALSTGVDLEDINRNFFFVIEGGTTTPIALRRYNVK